MECEYTISPALAAYRYFVVFAAAGKLLTLCAGSRQYEPCYKAK